MLQRRQARLGLLRIAHLVLLLLLLATLSRRHDLCRAGLVRRMIEQRANVMHEERI